MDTFTASGAKNHFGRLLDTAQREPVTIEKMGRPVAVLLSKHRYDLLQAELQDLRSQAETDFLMRGKNGARLMESIQQLEGGNVIVRTMDDLDTMPGDAD